MSTFDIQDNKFMRLALSLAQKGRGSVLPNPLVGAVVVKDGDVIGQGYHEKYGCDHAEVNALREAGKRAEGATIYVSLEPCSHFGKTPPCVDKILEAKVRRVVVAMQDPNSFVAGKGIAKLRAAGMRVDVGLLAEEAKSLNRPFVKYITTKLPFVTLKIAQTLEGRSADSEGHSKWITGEEARTLVHQWRFEAGAVLVGIGTVLTDDPGLTVRHVEGKQPHRIVLDSRLRIPLDCQLLSDDFVDRTIIFADDNNLSQEKAKTIESGGAKVILLPCVKNRLQLSKILHALGELKIAHVLVEGGAEIFSSFVHKRCADRLCLFIAQKMFGLGSVSLTFPGFSADNPLKFQNMSWRRVGEDMLFEADFVCKT